VPIGVAALVSRRRAAVHSEVIYFDARLGEQLLDITIEPKQIPASPAVPNP
jgi:hypothetical protein